MKIKILRYILGGLLLAQIFPIIFGTAHWGAAPSSHENPFLEGYISGLQFDLLIIVVLGIIFLAAWLFGVLEGEKDITPRDAHEYFQENMSGEPLTEETVIWHLKEFVKLHTTKQFN